MKISSIFCFLFNFLNFPWKTAAFSANGCRETVFPRWNRFSRRFPAFPSIFLLNIDFKKWWQKQRGKKGQFPDKNKGGKRKGFLSFFASIVKIVKIGHELDGIEFYWMSWQIFPFLEKKATQFWIWKVSFFFRKKTSKNQVFFSICRETINQLIIFI